MPYMLVRHKIEDYAKWKPVYDRHVATERPADQKGRIFFAIQITQMKS